MGRYPPVQRVTLRLVRSSGELFRNCAGLRNHHAALTARAERRLVAHARFAQHSDAVVAVEAA
jgi:hypothetical protein